MREPRQRMAGTQRHRERREQRLDVVAESVAQRRLLLRVELAHDSRRMPRRASSAKHAAAHADCRAAISPTDAKTPAICSSAVSPSELGFGRRLARRAESPGHAHHEELVDVRADDRQKAQALGEAACSDPRPARARVAGTRAG